MNLARQRTIAVLVRGGPHDGDGLLVVFGDGFGEKEAGKNLANGLVQVGALIFRLENLR
jgi:hypothetical protein